jgi:hypothetical protein
MAKADQMAIVIANGGIEAVVAKGGFGATPPPGVNAEFANGNNRLDCLLQRNPTIS